MAVTWFSNWSMLLAGEIVEEFVVVDLRLMQSDGVVSISAAVLGFGCVLAFNVGGTLR